MLFLGISNNVRAGIFHQLGLHIPLVALAIVIYCLNAGVVGPMIQADEGSYLANAAAIASYKNDLASSYHAGYSLLIAPAFLIGENPNEVWKLVRLTNALLFWATGLLLWGLANRWGAKIPRTNRMIAVGVVLLYPMWVVLVGYSFAQIAFVPVYVLLVLLIHEASSGCRHCWIFAGLTASFLYWIHPTGVVAVIGVVLVFAFVAWLKKKWRNFTAFLFSLVMGVVAYRSVFAPWLITKMSHGGSPTLHYPNAIELLNPLYSFEGWLKFLTVLSGHIFYISFGSLATFAVGLIVAIIFAYKKLCHNKKPIDEEYFGMAIGLAFVGVSSVGILLLSSLFMVNAERLDHWMYGRYVEAFAAPVLLAGVLYFDKRMALWSVFVTFLFACFFAFGLSDFGHTAKFNIPTFWQEFYLREMSPFVWVLAGLIAAAIAGLAPGWWRYFYIASVFCFCSYLQIEFHNRASAVARERSSAAYSIRAVQPMANCVGFDSEGLESYQNRVFWNDFGFVLYDLNFRRMTVDDWIKNCKGPFFSYKTSLGAGATGAVLVDESPHSGPLLWARAGSQYALSPKYPLSVTNGGLPFDRILLSGWNGAAGSSVWTTERAALELPTPSNCIGVECVIRLRVAVPLAQQNNFSFLRVSYRDGGGARVKDEKIPNDHYRWINIPITSTEKFVELKIDFFNSDSSEVGLENLKYIKGVLAEIDFLPRAAISFYGKDFFSLPRKIGVVENGRLASGEGEGFLFFGPYAKVKAGSYRLVVRGGGFGDNVSEVDVVSGKGTAVHFRRRVNGGGNGSEVLLDAFFNIDVDSSDLEVRMTKMAGGNISVLGYDLFREFDKE